MQLIQSLFRIRTDFEHIFFKNEYKALSGPKRRTIVALWSILTLTFLALGFAVGGLKNLKKKIDNPFTNWVDVEVRNSHIARQLHKIRERYNEPEVIKALDLKNMTGWVKFYQDFYANGYDPIRHSEDTLLYQLPGRTVEPEEPLLATILDKKSGNLVWHSPEFDVNDPASLGDCDVVISTNMMERLGITDTAQLNYLCSRDSVPLFIRVVAVVRELPNFCSFICTPKLYNVLKLKRDKGKLCQDLIVRNKPGQNVFYFMYDPAENLGDLDTRCAAFFPKYTPTVSAESELRSGTRTWGMGTLAFPPASTPAFDSVRLFLQQVRQGGFAVSEYCTIDCGAPMCGRTDPADYYYLAFNFEYLDKIRAFRADMLKQFGVDVDMSQVESKENFALVSNLTFIISLILLGFGILSIVLFVNNLLRTHLFEVRSNLGTFQAFGLDNRFLTRIYLKIILAFMLLSITLALALAVVVDRVEQALYGDESRFDIFNLWIAAAIAGLLVVSLQLSVRTIRRILGDTPGNLIYER